MHLKQSKAEADKGGAEAECARGHEAGPLALGGVGVVHHNGDAPDGAKVSHSADLAVEIQARRTRGGKDYRGQVGRLKGYDGLPVPNN